MTNREIRYEMMKYFAENIGCAADDFLADENKVYLYDDDSSEKEFFRMMCFGKAAVTKVNKVIYDWCKSFVSKYVGFRCFDGVQMSLICRELSKYDYAVSCGQGAVPDINFKRKNADILFNIRIFAGNEIKNFYSNEIDESEWHMLYYSEESEYIIAAYDKDIVVGFAVADRNTDVIYDIGYEVLPAYRQRGIATALTTNLTNILLSRDIIPYLGFAWSNIASKNTAIKSGYIMAWSNMGVCDKDFAEKVFRGEAGIR